MRTVVAFAAVLALASASVVRQEKQTVPTLGGPATPDSSRTCTKSGEKCAGAPGQPLVEFKACCDERLTCGVPKELPSNLWGQFCVLAAQVDEEATKTANGGSSGPAAAAGAGAAGAAAGTAAGAGASSTTAAPTTAAAGATSAAATTTADDAAATSDDPDATSEDDDSSSGGTLGGADASSTDEGDDDDDDGSVCFPADATVELKDGSVVPMAKLAVGDVVKVGVNSFSEVFMFTHKLADIVHKFVTLETSSGASLALTQGHYIFADGSLVAASQVKVGSTVTLGNGETDKVVAVGSKTGAGLYNPQTVNGNVVVNGIVASTYTTAVEPAFAHAILSPFRLLNNLGLQFSSFESGGGVLADVAPRGQAAF